MNLQALPPLIGTSPAIRHAVALVERYAPTTLPILVVGPTGTGKELVARHIHHGSGRAGRFVPVNCGALPREMAESLLFGHRRGAFSGAVESRRGYVACADGGTLFLDEMLCLSLEGQAKLLRALDTGEIQPLGEETERFVDVRIVATVQQEVWAGLEDGTFRSDLFQRVAGILIALPALAERAEDIEPIARYFTEQTGRTLEAGSQAVLEQYDWPGNVRELRQVIERAGRLVENGTLPPAAVAEAVHMGARPPRRHPLAALRMARERWRAIGEANDWNVDRMAQALGIGRTQLYARARASGVSLREIKKSGLFAERSPDKPNKGGVVAT